MALSADSNTLLNTTTLETLKMPRVAIVFTEWNDKIVAEQLSGCHKILEQHKAVITSRHAVPGCFELPYACNQLGQYTINNEQAPEAIIAFGAVIRGGTPHFEYVCKAVTEGLTRLNITLHIPVIFGVLTLNTEAEAWERLGGLHGHKGEEAAITALKMIAFKRSLQP